MTMSVSSSPNAANMYAVFGNDDTDMVMPPAWQAPQPFGVNIGGVNPAMWSLGTPASTNSQYDSWLSCGIANGDLSNSITSVGLEFSSWTETTGIGSNNAAVLWTNPGGAPGNDASGSAVVAQVTTRTGLTWTAGLGAQGRSASGDDFTLNDLQFGSALAGGGGGGGRGGGH